MKGYFEFDAIFNKDFFHTNRWTEFFQIRAFRGLRIIKVSS